MRVTFLRLMISERAIQVEGGSLGAVVVAGLQATAELLAPVRSIKRAGLFSFSSSGIIHSGFWEIIGGARLID
jgi:hypothetical protein